jgi:putative ABC transport system permease protein
MIKKTQLLDARRNIRGRIVSYLSICLVITMGIGAYLTTVYMETGINREAAEYYKDRAFKDFEMISSLGASDANIQAIANTPGVVDAEGVLRFDGSLRSGDQKRNITAISLTERVSVPVLVDGRLPSAEDECAIGEDFSEISGIGIGDEAVIYLSDNGSGDPLVTHSFTITGLIKHPDYVHRKLTDTVVMPLSAFTRDEGERIYTQVFVKAENVPNDDAFLDTYYDSLSD